jgi:hypothetical protein
MSGVPGREDGREDGREPEEVWTAPFKRSLRELRFSALEVWRAVGGISCDDEAGIGGRVPVWAVCVEYADRELVTDMLEEWFAA